MVDNSEDIRELVRLLPTQPGHRVVAAANGREAVAAVSAGCPALILMDITMPVLDGLEATRMIRVMAEATGSLWRKMSVTRLRAPNTASPWQI